MSVNLHSLRNVRVEGGNGNWGWPGIREENGFVGGGGGGGGLQIWVGGDDDLGDADGGGMGWDS